MKISLITTTFDRPEYLLYCAKSVAKQSLPCYEWIIFIDDNDFNKYKDVLKTIKVLVPQTVIKGGFHIGRVNALNLAHKEAKGDYCALLDDDDWLHPQCLNECSKFDTDIIYTDFYCVDINNSIVIGARNQVPFNMNKMLKTNIMFHFRLYKTSLFHSVGGFDTSFKTTMDYEITLRMLSLKPTITKINLPLYYYRVHQNSITGKYPKLQRINGFRAIKKYNESVNYCQSLF